MMYWIKQNPFVLSANMHAGAIVASKYLYRFLDIHMNKDIDEIF